MEINSFFRKDSHVWLKAYKIVPLVTLLLVMNIVLLYQMMEIKCMLGAKESSEHSVLQEVRISIDL